MRASLGISRHVLAGLESITLVYLFANYQNEKSLYVISNNELCEIIAYVEQYELI